jgi:type I restriction enzyme, S subunit
MNSAQLLTHFHRLAEAPDAIPRLRRFILDLAVRGKLVPQNPKDEPAAKLLQRIQTEKERLVKEGKMKKGDALPNVDAKELAFRLPAGWCATRLEEIAACLNYMREPINGTEREQRITGKTQAELYPYYGATQQQGWIDEFIFDEELILLGEDGVPFFDDLRPKAYLISGKSWVNNHAHVFRGILVSNLFVLHCLNTFDYTGRVAGATRGKLNKSKAVEIPIPLPPLAEQRRIVAKVTDLMGLCDRLEAAQAEREQQRDRLAAATHAGLSTTETQHSSFFLRHFPQLTTRPDQIPKLRQTILNLAVRGKLLPQDPKDESATAQLKSIHRSRRVRRKVEKIDESSLETPLFKLPQSWSWTIVDQIAADHENSITDGPFGANLKTAHYIDSPGYRVIRLQNIGRSTFRGEHVAFVDEERYRRLSKHHVYSGDLVVAGLVDPLVRCCILPEEIGPAMVKADCYRLAVHPEVEAGFVMLYLNSSPAQAYAAAHHHGMTLIRIGLGNFRAIPIPLPPLAEQRRIVAKVEELMALCDQMETKLHRTQTESRRLLASVLHETLAA